MIRRLVAMSLVAFAMPATSQVIERMRLTIQPQIPSVQYSDSLFTPPEICNEIVPRDSHPVYLEQRGHGPEHRPREDDRQRHELPADLWRNRSDGWRHGQGEPAAAGGGGAGG